MANTMSYTLEVAAQKFTWQMDRKGC